MISSQSSPSFPWRIARATLVAMASLASACAVFKGQPDPPFSAALYQSAGQHCSGTPCEDTALFQQKEVKELVDTDDHDVRNKVIEHAMSVINLRYSQFRHDFVENRTHLRSGIDAFALLLNVAGTLTEATVPLQNYAAGGVIANGIGSNIDTNYLLNLTVESMVAQMDAGRSAVELRIRSSMKQSIADYSGGQALSDLVDYFNAGTFIAAIRKTAADATSEDKTNQVKISELRLVPEEERKDIAQITNQLARIQDTPENRQLLSELFTNIKLAPPAANETIPKIVQRLNTFRSNADAAGLKFINTQILASGLVSKGAKS